MRVNNPNSVRHEKQLSPSFHSGGPSIEKLASASLNMGNDTPIITTYSVNYASVIIITGKMYYLNISVVYLSLIFLGIWKWAGVKRYQQSKHMIKRRLQRYGNAFKIEKDEDIWHII